MPENNWYVLTGGPSTGKTTLLAELERVGFLVVPEAARTIIDEAAKKGISATQLRAVESDFQHSVTKLKRDTELRLSKNTVTFLDRGMHDTLAYLRCMHVQLEDWERDLMRSSSYKMVFLLDPLPSYQKDYARTENDKFVQDIHEALYSAYDEFDMKPIRVPAMSVKQRAAFILDRMQQTEGAF